MKKIVLLLFIVVSLVSCFSNKSKQNLLEPIEIIKLKISEPSGITAFKNNLYIVCDNNKTYYKTSLEGEILNTFKTNFSDLEGITFNSRSNTFWLTNEGERELFELDSIGNFIQKIKIKGIQTSKNSGLEGICFVENLNNFFVINEKSPKQLLQLTSTGDILASFNLNFSNDVSGICFDEATNSFWIVSDKSEAIYNIDKRGNLLNSYRIPVQKAEGIVVLNNRMYIVSDSTSQLYIFKMPD